jgi:hypothetical protein
VGLYNYSLEFIIFKCHLFIKNKDLYSLLMLVSVFLLGLGLV